MKRYPLFIIILATFLFGCAQENSTSRKEETAEPGIIEHITGADRIKIYEETKSKVKEIDKTLKERFQGF